MEDYLEAIIMLKEDGRESTVTAISELIGVKKPSVNWALKNWSMPAMSLMNGTEISTLLPRELLLPGRYIAPQDADQLPGRYSQGASRNCCQRRLQNGTCHEQRDHKASREVHRFCS